MTVFEEYPSMIKKQNLTTIIVFGASGDLAKRKTFPALYELFTKKLLPKHTRIIGYARSPLNREDFLKRIKQYIKSPGDDIAAFEELCEYRSGEYGKPDDFQQMHARVRELEGEMDTASGGKNCGVMRIYYLALPPTTFVEVAGNIKENLYSNDVTNHLVIEKPFGSDRDSSKVLGGQISKYFREEEIFRTDHYLGKDMVKNLMALRFANTFYDAVWNKEYISNVQITFKEKIGTQGRGGYFDEFGIIRDVIQNHLMQVLSIIAMETPKSLDAEDIRDCKAAVLKCIPPATLDETLLGQYTASEDGSEPGYLDDETVRKGSNTPTFAMTTLHIDNDRWRGVPFVVKAGKALEDARVSVRIQFKDMKYPLFPNMARNELVIRISPAEAIYMKTVVKEPGLTNNLALSELDLTYQDRYTHIPIPDAYASLILDVLGTDHSNFVRADELDESWRIFTPLLHQIDNENITPLPYRFGSRGPEGESNFLEVFGGYVKPVLAYNWKKASAKI
ncbi:Glucose-6-phosphate 1-dehydrogenase [Zancudomyces culisetae]|uniref:Glucose-6-phosphate 1-dehydrogenase n=1 Tax=Zancudomyces culisetae TaxID=1213189 RepID=A0A1R1PGA1_ZANCU|nr:Glucose-6-phosphate 1-dehydrogenase [Zancudomyces culisetae]|eukprot:OMH80010.1 Glucose-6-phosphate 1-dehydrogenase [Zancudomyces culisetae]